MTREEAIDRLKEARVGHKEFLSVETLNMAIKALEKEPCEDEYIKVPKKALKYRTAGMVAYNAEWLKNHFDIERAVICGAQEPCEDAISREEAIGIVAYIKEMHINDREKYQINYGTICDIDSALQQLPPVTPQPKTGRWISFGIQGEIDGQIVRVFTCSECGAISIFRVSNGNIVNGNLCPNCGAKMWEESE